MYARLWDPGFRGLAVKLQWGLFPANLNPVQGSEQAGTRPVLVISREAIHGVLPVVTVLPLTSLKPGRRVYSTEVLVPGGTAGLRTDSLVMAHQVRTLSKTRLGSQLGNLESEALRNEVRAALALYLDLEHA